MMRMQQPLLRDNARMLLAPGRLSVSLRVVTRASSSNPSAQQPSKDALLKRPQQWSKGLLVPSRLLSPNPPLVRDRSNF